MNSNFRFLRAVPNQEAAERFRREQDWAYEGEERLADGSVKRSFRCGDTSSRRRTSVQCPFRAYYLCSKGSDERAQVRVFVSARGHNHPVAGTSSSGTERRMAGKSPKTQVTHRRIVDADDEEEEELDEASAHASQTPSTSQTTVRSQHQEPIRLSIKRPHSPQHASVVSNSASPSTAPSPITHHQASNSMSNGGEGTMGSLPTEQSAQISPQLALSEARTKRKVRRRKGPWLKFGKFGVRKKREQPPPDPNRPKVKRPRAKKSATAKKEAPKEMAEAVEETQKANLLYPESKAEEKLRLKGLSKNPHTDELVLASPDLNKPYRWQEYEFFDSLAEWEQLSATKGLVESGKRFPAENYIVKRMFYCARVEQKEERMREEASSSHAPPKNRSPTCHYKICLLVDERSGRCRAFESVPNTHTCGKQGTTGPISPSLVAVSKSTKPVDNPAADERQDEEERIEIIPDKSETEENLIGEPNGNGDDKKMSSGTEFAPLLDPIEAGMVVDESAKSTLTLASALDESANHGQ